MMRAFSAITIFCEDLREEVQLHSLIGILPDNIQVQSVPAALPKLGIYTRIVFDPKQDVNSILVALRAPDGTNISLMNVDLEIVEKAKLEMIETGNPIAGIIVKALVSPFNFSSEGTILSMVSLNGDEIVAGGLNIRLLRPDDSIGLQQIST